MPPACRSMPQAVFLGAIPVLAEAELLLPFCDVVDWRPHICTPFPPHTRMARGLAGA